ncbi:MAG: preprotein translocase subunit SecG [Kiritimatiellales bacterium]|nr:preprotein translocase subunit SecG [Kiritimatiellales bacterium]
MIFLRTLSIIIEILCCLLLSGIILLQKSKSEGLGMAFGSGMGESLFGARAGNVLTKGTVLLSIVFIVNTVVLGVIFSRGEKSLIDSSAPSVPPITAPAAPAEPPQPVAAPQGTESL